MLENVIKNFKRKVKKTIMMATLSSIVLSPFAVIKYKDTKKKETWKKCGAPLDVYVKYDEYYFDPNDCEKIKNNEEGVYFKKMLFKKMYKEILREYDIAPKEIFKSGLGEEFIKYCVNLIFAENSYGKLNNISKSEIINKNFDEKKIGRGVGQFTYYTWVSIIKDIGKERIEELGFDYKTVMSYKGWLKYTLPRNGRDAKERYNILKLNLMAIIDNAKLNEKYLIENARWSDKKKLLEAVILSHNSGPYVQLREWKRHRRVFKGYKRVRNVRGGELKPFYKNLDFHKNFGWYCMSSYNDDVKIR